MDAVWLQTMVVVQITTIVAASIIIIIATIIIATTMLVIPATHVETSTDFLMDLIQY